MKYVDYSEGDEPRNRAGGETWRQLSASLGAWSSLVSPQWAQIRVTLPALTKCQRSGHTASDFTLLGLGEGQARGSFSISPGDSNAQPGLQTAAVGTQKQWRPSLCAQNAVKLRKEIHLISTNIINTDLVPGPVLGIVNMEMSKSGSTARCSALQSL